MIIYLLASAVFQVVPGAIYARVPLMVAAFLLGLTAQGSNSVSTLSSKRMWPMSSRPGLRALRRDLQCDAGSCGRDRRDHPASEREVGGSLVVMAVGYLLLAVVFALVSRGVSMNEGHRVATGCLLQLLLQLINR